jgi:hypothetical protein
VRSYVRDSLDATPGHSSDASEVTTIRSPLRPKFATFSRPPPPSSSHPFSGASDVDEAEITRRLTRTANDIEDDINSHSPMSTVRPATVPEVASAEFLKDSDSKRAITVPG